MRTRKTDRPMMVIDTLHGVAVPDPYRWLEDGDAEEVRAWTDAQNARTRKFLDALPNRASLKAEILELLQIGYVTAPSIRRNAENNLLYFHTRREGSQNQPTLYVRTGVSGKDRPLIDVAALSEDGTTALDWWYPSWDGSLLAWGKSESGSEDSVLSIRDVATGQDLPNEKIDRTRYASVAWLPDGKSFYYSRYPDPSTVPAGEERYHAKIYLHVLGQDPANDTLVFGEGRDKTDLPTVAISPNGRWLVFHVHMGWDKSEIFLRDLSEPSAPIVNVAVNLPALFDAQPKNDRLYIQTNHEAPRYKLYAVDYDKAGERAAWKELIAEHQEDVLSDVRILKHEIVATYMHEASSRVERFSLDGTSKGAIALPAIGTATIASMNDGEELFINFASFVIPYQVHRLDLRSEGHRELWDTVGANLRLLQRHEDIDVRQMHATSKDGTRVPMFVVSKRGATTDGAAKPTILYGYGGFNVNQTPAFSAYALASVSRGAIWVTSILRGGGELGEDWHQAGMLDRKQNTFDDLYACAELLFRQKITTPDRLAVMGGSNGGLLVAAAVTQHPEMFRVGLSLVPLTDMIRYHHFRIAKLWIPEYGDPDNAEHFKFLYAYSPYHHVKPNTRYPAMLFTTAESDTRVDPMHARKMAALMQETESRATTNDASTHRPVLLRVETKAGHGQGKPVTKLAEELTDELSFMLSQIGVAL